jgi:hypothetical protein
MQSLVIPSVRLVSTFEPTRIVYWYELGLYLNLP